MRKTNPQTSPLIGRDSVLSEARLLLSKTTYSHEDAARVSGLLGLAERLPGRNGTYSGPTEPEGEDVTAFRIFCQGKRARRDLALATATQTTATPDLVAQGFLKKLAVVLKLYDPLFDPDVVNSVEMLTGAPLIIPGFDDTANAAQILGEDEQDFLDNPGLIVNTLASAPTFRSGILPISRELVMDSAIPLADILAAAFAVRLMRGVGANLYSTLASAAKVGRTAVGSADNTGGAETGASSIGWADLIALRKSVNKAYRQSPKCAWLMNDDTLADLDSLLDKSGRPFIIPEYNDAGQRLLMGYPALTCPSADDIGASKTPVLFGDLNYFLVRFVSGWTNIAILRERLAEYDKICFRAQMRANSALLGVTSTDSPVKALQNAAS